MLKVELGVTNAVVREQWIEYDLHLTLRLVKLIFVDDRSIT